MTDALNIHDGILKLKRMVLQRRAAWTRGTGFGGGNFSRS